MENPAEIPWMPTPDIVLESTGKFTDAKDASMYLKAGARKVIISALLENADITIVMRVNEDKYDPEKHHVISNASCTTNCFAPLVKVLLQNEFGIISGMMTTIHSYTNDQRILDLPHKDLRRGRAAVLSIIPTSTGAGKALGRVIPETEGKFFTPAIRVPTPNVSMVDLSVILEKDVSCEEINQVFKEASRTYLRGILEYCTDEVVSCDLKVNPHSAILDSLLTEVVNKRMVKIIAWYDNEWGYACRIIDLIRYIAIMNKPHKIN